MWWEICIPRESANSKFPRHPSCALMPLILAFSVGKNMISTTNQTLRFTEPLPGISDVENIVQPSYAITDLDLGHTAKAVPRKDAATTMTSPFVAARYKDAVTAAMTVSKTELQALYVREYNSLRSRKQQAKQRHIKFADSLKDIRDWLIHLGPRPSKGYSVDRIKSAKGYVPNNLRWATNIVQTQNRKVTKWHQLPDGSRLTTMQFAKRLGVTYPALYKRLNNGWTVDRLLQGEPPMTLEEWRFPAELTLYCQPIYNQFRKLRRLPRIEWFIDHFSDLVWGLKRGKELSLESNTLQSLTSHVEKARQEHKAIVQAIKHYEDQKLQDLIAIYDPPNFSTTASTVHASDHDL
jgi:hypothetical protein